MRYCVTLGARAVLPVGLALAGRWPPAGTGGRPARPLGAGWPAAGWGLASLAESLSRALGGRRGGVVRGGQWRPRGEPERGGAEPQRKSRRRRAAAVERARASAGRAVVGERERASGRAQGMRARACRGWPLASSFFSRVNHFWAGLKTCSKQIRPTRGAAAPSPPPSVRHWLHKLHFGAALQKTGVCRVPL